MSEIDSETSYWEWLFEDNFFLNCFNNPFSLSKCVLSGSMFSIGFILLIINIIAFTKMTKFYKKFNFENSLIFLNIIQTIILELVLVTSFDIFFEFFFLTQILNISLIVRKFIILLNQSDEFCKRNGIFLSLNLLNLIIFIVFPIYFRFNDNGHLIFRVIYRIFHVFVNLLLAYYCTIFIKVIEKYKNDEDKSYFYLYSNEGSPDIVRRFSSYFSLDKEVEDDTKKGIDSIFYSKKKKQITYLCITNLLCSFGQITFTILRNFVLNDNFIDKKNKTIPSEIKGNILYLIYLIICFLDVMVNFVCFFWIIRHQYITFPDESSTNNDRPTHYLDEEFIHQENRNLKRSKKSDAEEYISSENNKSNENQNSNINTESEETENVNQESDGSKQQEDMYASRSDVMKTPIRNLKYDFEYAGLFPDSNKK